MWEIGNLGLESNVYSKEVELQVLLIQQKQKRRDVLLAARRNYSRLMRDLDYDSESWPILLLSIGVVLETLEPFSMSVTHLSPIKHCYPSVRPITS